MSQDHRALSRGTAIAVERWFDVPISGATPAPWGTKNRTILVELADGRRLAVQEYSDRRTAEIRLRAAEQLAGPLNDVGVPVPRVLTRELIGPSPWAAFELLPGEPGYVAADHDLSAANFPSIARDMGLLARRIRELDPAAFELPNEWRDLRAVSRRAQVSLRALEPHLAAADVRMAAGIVDRVPELYGGRATVVCHGDLGPQNVLVAGDRVSALLDLEDVRLGDPLLDVACWAWLVRAHTPAAFAGTWSSFLGVAAIDRDADRFDERVLALIVLRLLETADAYRASAPAKHPGWAERLANALGWRGQPLS